MNSKQPTRFVLLVGVSLALLTACNKSSQSGTPVPSSLPDPGSEWLGIPSAVNQVIVFLHDGTGWLLNKSQVSIKKVGEVRVPEPNRSECVADFEISVEFGSEMFETTAKDLPCDKDGIPTDASVDRLRSAVEEIKVKMKRLQN